MPRSEDNHAEMDQRPRKRSRHGNGDYDGKSDRAAALRVIDAHDAEIALRREDPTGGVIASSRVSPPVGSGTSNGQRSGLRFNTGTVGDVIPDASEYFSYRQKLAEHEDSIAFDSRCRARATELEQRVDAILHRLRCRDASRVYGSAKPRRGHAGQMHPRFAGDHFLSNVDLIDQTALFDVAHRMPKGTHLHIHFNACLPPKALLDIAKGMDRMFVTSDLPLISDSDFENFDKCELQFSILSPEKEKPGDIFSSSYQARQTMKLSAFLQRFSQYYSRATVDQWLLAKLLFEEQETHGLLQTSLG